MAHRAFLNFPWRWIIPFGQLVVYISLVVISGGPPKPSTSVAFDLNTPASVQLAFAINSPAYLLANLLIGLTGWEGEMVLVRLVGCLLLPQWSAVGWWIEHLKNETPKPQLRGRRRFAMILWGGLLGLTITVLAATWWRILDDPSLLRSEAQKVVIGCLLWPISVIAASWQQIRLNLRRDVGSQS